MRADALPPLDDHTILCLQAGDVNTGAFDPAEQIIPKAPPLERGCTWTERLACGRPLRRPVRI
jgi:hypothetical protein